MITCAAQPKLSRRRFDKVPRVALDPALELCERNQHKLPTQHDVQIRLHSSLEVVDAHPQRGSSFLPRHGGALLRVAGSSWLAPERVSVIVSCPQLRSVWTPDWTPSRSGSSGKRSRSAPASILAGAPCLAATTSHDTSDRTRGLTDASAARPRESARHGLQRTPAQPRPSSGRRRQKLEAPHAHPEERRRDDADRRRPPHTARARARIPARSSRPR